MKRTEVPRTQKIITFKRNFDWNEKFVRIKLSETSQMLGSQVMQRRYSVRTIFPTDYEPLRALHMAAIMAVNPAIYSQHIKHGWAHGLSADGYGRAVANGEAFDIACDLSGKPVGFCGCKGDEIYGLYVHPDMQGQGIGAELLKRGEARLAGWGVKRSPLRATLAGVRFYRSQGWHFLRIAHLRTRGGPMMEIALMEKDLEC
ncbi:MAG: GNAT family N-acetyltransferase [Beijerinckiaceae bacterium]